MAIRFNNFQNSRRGETPQFAAAAARQGQLDQAAKEAENAMRTQNIMGAVNLYDKSTDAMGVTPISDALRGGIGGNQVPEGSTSIVGRDAGTIDPMNIGDGSAISDVSGGETFSGEFSPQGDWLGAGEGTIDAAGNTIMDVGGEAALDAGVDTALTTGLETAGTDALMGAGAEAATGEALATAGLEGAAGAGSSGLMTGLSATAPYLAAALAAYQLFS